MAYKSYPRSPKLTKSLASAKSKVDSAKRLQLGGQVGMRTVDTLDKLFTKQKEAKKIYSSVENWLKEQNLESDILMPSFGDFVQGKNVNVNYKGIDVPLTQLEQASYVKNPNVDELIDRLGLKSDPTESILKLLEDK
tara:strand:- start:209 stop:619 length:411 start_codon:yes stop_codon:yes gene_type:complete